MEIPTTMPVIAHVAVTVTDLEASTEWYNPGVMLRLGGAGLAPSRPSAPG